jgi:hypothetical protein
MDVFGPARAARVPAAGVVLKIHGFELSEDFPV